MYCYLRPFDVQLDLFLDGLTEEDESIKEFAMGGVCNCICGTILRCFRLDPFFARQVLENKANLHPILRLLSSTNENTLVSALTTLYYLCEYPEGKQRMVASRVPRSLSEEERYQGSRSLRQLRQCQAGEHRQVYSIVSSLHCLLAWLLLLFVWPVNALVNATK